MPKEGLKKVLITGASGLLGANIIKNLPENWQTVGVVNKHKINPPNERASIKECGPFNAVIHTAALTNVDQCEEDKDLAYKLNVKLTEEIVFNCAVNNIFLLHISTDHIFDGKDGNYDEDSEPAPINYYAETKLLAEEKVKIGGAKYAIIRTNFFGYNVQNKNDLAGWIVKSLRGKMPVRLFKDVFFSPILVDYLIDFIVEIVEEKKEGLFNIAAGDSCSKYDFGMKLAEALDLDKSLISSISVEESGLKVKRPKNMTLDTAKAKKIFKNKIPLIDESIEKYKELDKIYNQN